MQVAQNGTCENKIVFFYGGLVDVFHTLFLIWFWVQDKSCTQSREKPLNILLQLLCLANVEENAKDKEGQHSTFTRASRSYVPEFISKNSANPFSTIKRSSWWVKQPCLCPPPFPKCLCWPGEKGWGSPALNAWLCSRLRWTSSWQLPGTAGASHRQPPSHRDRAGQQGFHFQNKETNSILEYPKTRALSDLIRCHFNSPPRKADANTL